MYKTFINATEFFKSANKKKMVFRDRMNAEIQTIPIVAIPFLHYFLHHTLFMTVSGISM